MENNTDYDKGILAERKRIAELLRNMTSKYRWSKNPEYTLLSIEGMFKDLGLESESNTQPR